MPEFRKVYIYLTGRVTYHNIDSDEVDYYMTRTIDATIVANNPPTFVAVYAKFNRFTFWATLLGGNPKGLESVKINPTGGVINLPQRLTDSYMIHFFRNRIMQQKQLPVVSEKQKKIIEQDFEKYKDSFLKSDAADAMRNDLFLSEDDWNNHSTD